MNKFLTIIVPASVAAHMQSLAAHFSGGGGMFTTPLTSDGATISHYISSGWLEDGVAAYLPFDSYSSVYDVETDTTTIEVTSDAGDLEGLLALLIADEDPVITTITDIQNLANACDISTQKAQDAMARLGLTRYQSDEVV